MKLLMEHVDLGLKAYVNFNWQDQVYEVFADETGQAYLGCADTLSEARECARQWFKEEENQ